MMGLIRREREGGSTKEKMFDMGGLDYTCFRIYLLEENLPVTLTPSVLSHHTDRVLPFHGAACQLYVTHGPLWHGRDSHRSLGQGSLPVGEASDKITLLRVCLPSERQVKGFRPKLLLKVLRSNM